MIKSGFVERNLKYLFPLPALLFVLLLMVFPVAYTLIVSFTNWSLTSGRPMRFAGLGSYLNVLREPRFWMRWAVRFTLPSAPSLSKR